jgi:hypothetical protein
MPAPFKVVFPRIYVKSDGQEQTQWVTIGSAFPNRQGGYDCSLWCLPLQNMRGEVRLMILPDDSDARRGPGQGSHGQGDRQNFGGTHRDQFGGNAAAAGAGGHTSQGAEAYYPGKPDDKLPF